MKNIFIIFISIGLISCTTLPNVTNVGPDLYSLSASSGQGEARSSDLALKRANSYCAGMGKEASITDTQVIPRKNTLIGIEGASTYSVGYYETEVTFRCQ